MSLITKFIFLILIFCLVFSSKIIAEEMKNIGKFNDWETIIITEESGKVCFAQSSPVLQTPESSARDAKLFVTFRTNENISNEVSTTAGYEFNQNNSVTATFGEGVVKFDIKEQGFAWIADNKIEENVVAKMKKGSKIIIKGHNEQGTETSDQYSLSGFTKAYNAARMTCS